MIIEKLLREQNMCIYRREKSRRRTGSQGIIDPADVIQDARGGLHERVLIIAAKRPLPQAWNQGQKSVKNVGSAVQREQLSARDGGGLDEGIEEDEARARVGDLLDVGEFEEDLEVSVVRSFFWPVCRRTGPLPAWVKLTVATIE